MSIHEEYTEYKPYISPLTHVQIQNLSPDIIINDTTFTGPRGVAVSIGSFMTKVGVLSMLGASENIRGAEVSIYIASNGGSVYLAQELVSNLKQARQLFGVTYTCYVERAISAAFSVVMDLCDEKVGVFEQKLCQHKSFFMTRGGYRSYPADALLTDLELANMERTTVVESMIDWLAISRPEDGSLKCFSPAEKDKYKLIDRSVILE